MFSASGCQELNIAVDSALGLGPAAAHAADNPASFAPFKLAANKPSKRSANGRGPAASAGGGKVTERDVAKKVPKGKKRAPALRAPVKTKAPTLQTEKMELEFPRNPFRPPADRILPSECPPSMPLCRFDRSQLKLVG